MSNPQPMSGERFVRVCPEHRHELADLWCPAGHTIEPVDHMGTPGEPFWCWDMKLGKRYAIVTGDRIQLDDWFPDVSPQIEGRSSLGFTPAVEKAEEREVNSTEATRRQREREEAAREGREPAEWARLQAPSRRKRAA